MRQIAVLGQTEPSVYQPIAQVYDELRSICLTKLPAETCSQLLPTRPFYLAPDERPRVPWWFVLAAGFVIGKMV